MTTEATRYTVLVRRPDSGKVDTYRQTTFDVISAIQATQAEFEQRNRLRLPASAVVLVVDEKYDPQR